MRARATPKSSSLTWTSSERRSADSRRDSGSPDAIANRTSAAFSHEPSFLQPTPIPSDLAAFDTAQATRTRCVRFASSAKICFPAALLKPFATPVAAVAIRGSINVAPSWSPPSFPSDPTISRIPGSWYAGCGALDTRPWPCLDTEACCPACRYEPPLLSGPEKRGPVLAVVRRLTTAASFWAELT